MKNNILLTIIVVILMPSVSFAQDKATSVFIEDALSKENNSVAIQSPFIDVLEAKDMDIKDVLMLISLKSGLNIVAGAEISGEITIYLKDIDARDALRIILDMNDLAYSEQDGLIRVMTAADYESRFGFPFGREVQTKIIALNFAKGEDLIELLNQVKSEPGKIIHNELNNSVILIDSPENIMTMTALIKDIDVPFKKEAIALRYLTAADVVEKIRETLSVDFKNITIDEQANSLIVEDKEKTIDEIRAFVEEIDQPEKEFHITIKTIQIILDEEYPKGVDWEAIVSSYQSLDFDNGDEVNKDGKLRLGTLTQEDFVVLLDALDTVGAVYEITEKALTSMDQQKSTFAVKSLNMLLTAEADNEGVNLEGVQEAKYSIVSRAVTNDILNVNFKPDFLKKNQKAKQKDINVELANASTMVVGGLFKTVKVEKLRKIPLLGDLPLLGFAFRSERERIAKAEIIVFVTVESKEKEEK